jgi:hypothetical protein
MCTLILVRILTPLRCTENPEFQSFLFYVRHDVRLSNIDERVVPQRNGLTDLLKNAVASPHVLDEETLRCLIKPDVKLTIVFVRLSLRLGREDEIAHRLIRRGGDTTCAPSVVCGIVAA